MKYKEGLHVNQTFQNECTNFPTDVQTTWSTAPILLYCLQV